MTRTRRALLVGLITAASGACGSSSATAPTTTLANSLVTIYQDPEFRGGSRALMGDIVDLDDAAGPCGTGVGGDWDDCISSIRIPAGWEVTVFQDDNYGGASAILTADVSDLERRTGPCGDGWDDCISSIRIRQR